ncbi:MAG: ABC transporter ATP-binding protein [Burkholderiaceae bacterium]
MPNASADASVADAASPVQSAPEAQATPVPFIRIAGIAKHYGSAVVLDSIDLDLHQRELVCLLGPSGCGKTTLLRILCGIETASAGHITLLGRDITHTPTAQRRFGVVFQSYALFPNLSALDNVAYGLQGMVRDKRKARALEMLDLVDLSAHALKYPAQLSGGQQQRVALARALAPQPQLLLLDEPLSALDAQVRHTLRGEIRRVQQQLGIPTVMVTHDQDEALAIADRVVLMNRGRIEQESAPAALYAMPKTEFSARFVGRINLWQAQVRGPRELAVGSAVLTLQEDTVSSSAPVLVGIRPERVQLHKADMAEQQAPAPQLLAANTFDAVVLGWTFCGAYISLHLNVPALGGKLDAELSTPAGGQVGWIAGEACQVHLPPGALHVLEQLGSDSNSGQ